MEIVTATQLAERLKITKRTLYRMIKQDMIPRKQVGGQWRFDFEEVMRTLEATQTSRIPISGKPQIDGPKAGA
jgi:excisionase family DNA binding protein